MIVHCAMHTLTSLPEKYKPARRSDRLVPLLLLAARHAHEVMGQHRLGDDDDLVLGVCVSKVHAVSLCGSKLGKRGRRRRGRTVRDAPVHDGRRKEQARSADGPGCSELVHVGRQGRVHGERAGGTCRERGMRRRRRR